jgi:urea carboxylase
MWNTFHTTAQFQSGTPWLLRFFDQIRFYPVSAKELLEIRDSFPHGKYPLRIEQQDFRLKDYHTFLASIENDAGAFKRHQQAAFLEERERWASAKLDESLESLAAEVLTPESDNAVPDGCRPVRSPITANVWNVAVEAGQRVEAGQKLIILEAMKMEIIVAAPSAGVVEKLNCGAGTMVLAGQQLITLRHEAAL